MDSSMSVAVRVSDIRRGLRLEYITISYNCLEGVIAVILGVLAGSIALTGFGLDSAIEVASGAALVWRLRRDGDKAGRESAEWWSLRLVGYSLVLLAIYVAAESAVSLYKSEAPQESIPGIILAAASVVVMPVLTGKKRRVASAIQSVALAADAKQTEFCAYLSAILLCGLLLNAVFGWWWADPLAALIMVPIITREGVSALRGKSCSAGCECL
jgi:divalent metal cation (Fe/Co/Zn/Cd) transporter